jgi:hypothetical protein
LLAVFAVFAAKYQPAMADYPPRSWTSVSPADEITANFWLFRWLFWLRAVL